MTKMVELSVVVLIHSLGGTFTIHSYKKSLSDFEEHEKERAFEKEKEADQHKANGPNDHISSIEEGYGSGNANGHVTSDTPPFGEHWGLSVRPMGGDLDRVSHHSNKME